LIVSTIYSFAVTLFLLCAMHFLADFPLQGPYLSETKNPWGKNNSHWPISLFAHVTIQGFGVFIVTNSLILALLEMILHTYIDLVKCRGSISFSVDQASHLVCKVAWAALYTCFMLPLEANQ
jgi:hypothetical protein